MERVCFIRPRGQVGPILLATAPDPVQLLAFLQAGNPQELELWGTVDATLFPESWWHETLNPWHVRGGWYAEKAQVLCYIEDALRGHLEPPERFDPTQDPPEEPEAVDRVPGGIMAMIETPAERAARKWAWPKVTPEELYPRLTPRPPKSTQALPVIRKLLTAAA